MARVRQYYGGVGVPMAAPADPAQIVAAWRSHRKRFRDWFAGLEDAEWTAETRCTEWQVRDIAQHLVSGSQFLGYTLHRARKGEATRLLADFDAQQTAKAATSTFDGLSLDDLLRALRAMDERVDAELDGLAIEGWEVAAEAPLGQVAAHVSVNHFLFDSWVHERDVMLPRGQAPDASQGEAAAVASYLVALAGVGQLIDDGPPADVSLRLQVTDLDHDLALTVTGGRSVVRYCEAGGAHNVSATAAALVDVATGRESAATLDADAEASRFLTRSALRMT